MVALVTLDRVKQALRIGEIQEVSGGEYEMAPHEDDTLIRDVYIPAASNAIVRHLKSRAEEILDLDSSGELPSGAEVPAEIEAAVIFLIGYWYRSPDADPEEDFEGDELPRPVKALLKMMRDPALA